MHRGERVPNLTPIAMASPDRNADHPTPPTRPTSGRPARWRALAAAATLGLGALVAVTACGSDQPLRVPDGARSAVTTDPSRGATPGSMTDGSAPDGTTPGSDPGRSDARITAFDLRTDLSCIGATDVELRVTFTTTDAVAVAFLVDQEQVPGTPPTSGTFDVPLPCDGNAHTVVLAALDHDGRATYQSRAVLTTTEARGD